MKEFQKTMGTQGIGVSYKDDTGIWNKYFLFSEIKEAEKYAQLLGYNYQSSKWYENSYSLFDKTYKKRKKKRLNTFKKKSDGLIKKFKTLLE